MASLMSHLGTIDNYNFADALSHEGKVETRHHMTDESMHQKLGTLEQVRDQMRCELAD